MSEFTPEQVAVPKIKLVRNAKGDCQWEISVIPGIADAELDGLRVQAVRQYHELEREMLGLVR